jgi:hypothetical protein
MGMRFEEAMRDGAAVRRESWWPSKVQVVGKIIDGFQELVMTHRTSEGLVDYPLSLGRPDWFATDWVIVVAEQGT